jgi:ferritin-like metal-binding protein YciE
MYCRLWAFNELPGSFQNKGVMRFMKAVRSTPSDEFEIVLVAELEELRKSEKALQKMYPRLKSKPQLRVHFLRQLVDMQHRAQRLDAVLNPIGALRFASSAPVAQSSVA